MTVLIVDDDPHVRDVVRYALERDGFVTAEAADGAEALRVFERVHPDLVVLDILMPEMDGTEVCVRLRARSRVPVIFLSSKDDEVDRIVGLELGGDDYLAKPFSPKELVARVRAVLRRTGRQAGTGGEPVGPAATPGAGARVLRHNRLTLDLDRHSARWDGREVPLTVTEFGLLAALLAFPGRVYSREELMERAYAEETIVSGRTIDSHVRRLRAKFAALGAEPVETVHGVGYRVSSCE